MEREIRWGILGTGAIAGSFAEGLAVLPDARLTAVGSRTHSSAREFARRHRVPRHHEGYAALVEDPDVDVVYVATPNHLHEEHSLLAIGAGKAVLCEKPFALDAEQARRVADAARRKGVFCMEAMWTRFVPVVREASRLTSRGELGELRMATFQLAMPFVADASSRQFAAALGGGSLLDLGVYGLSLSNLFFGKATHVDAQALIGPSGVDEQAAVLLQYGAGAQAVVTTSLRGMGANEALLVGTEGNLRLHAPLYCPERYTLTRTPPIRPGGGRARGRLARLRHHPLVRPIVEELRSRLPVGSSGRATTVTLRPTGNGYAEQAAEVMSCLREGRLESTVMPLGDTVEVLVTADRARSSWKRGIE